MAQFKPYASPRGFAPIEVPDVGSKIREQGRQQIQDMQRAAEFDLSNRDRMANAMRYVNEVESRNRDQIFRADQENRQRVQQQVQRNYETTISNIENQNKGQLKTLESIASFSNTAFETLGKVQANIEEGKKLAVNQAIYTAGISAKELMEIHKLDRNLTDQALSENAFVRDLIGRGASIQQIRYVAKHSNARYWSESKALAQNIGVGYNSYFNSNLSTPFQIGDRQISLAEAQRTGDLETEKAIVSQIRSKYMQESGMLNLGHQVLEAYVHPTIRATENQWQQESYATYRKLEATKAQEARTLALVQKIDTEGASGVNYWLQESQNKPADKAELFTTLQTLAKGDNWQQYQAFWQDYLTQQTTFNGKQITVGELLKADPGAIAVTESFVEARGRALRQFELENSEKIVSREQMIKAVLDQAKEQGIELTEADADAIEAEADAIAPGYDSSLLDNYRKNNTVNARYRKKIVDELTDLADRGLLTEERLDRMGIPATIAAQFRGLAKQTTSDYKANGGFKPQMDALAALAKSPPQIQAKPDGTYNWTVSLKTQQLQNRFLSKYAELKAAGDPNPVSNAFSFVQQQFAASASNPTSFSKGGYVEFDRKPTPSSASTARMQWVQSSIGRLGVKALDANGAIYTVSELNEIQKGMAKPGFKMDPMAEYVGMQMGVDPLTVINRQRIAAGMGQIALPESVTSFSTTVNPKVKRLLDSYRTAQISARAMVSTQQFNPGLVPKGYGPLVVEAAQKAGISPVFVAAFAEAENGSWDTNALSMGGAAAGVGLMQLSQEYHGPGGTVAQRERELKDPRLNLTLGAGILSGIYKKYGNWKDSIYVWNMGETGYKNWVDAGRPNTPQAGYAKSLYERFEKARAKYGDVSALRSGGTMRQSMQRYGRPSFERPSSVNFESSGGQPGVDLYFESKRFPAVLPGVVKDVSQEPGYGNYVVIESTDPSTGEKVDVLYGHLADGVSLRPGQSISAGDIIGTQGGTGNVRSADGTIASIDFLAPAPRGSKSMTPYRNYDNLRRFVVSQLSQ
jgi:hypothetical protein